VSGETGELRLERWLAAPPERVYAHFTEPALWQRWQGTAVELEPRPGGALRIALGAGGTGAAVGRFVELVPYSLVSFTWGYVGAPGPLAALAPGSTLVRVELEPERGGTRLWLRHGGLPPALRALHAEGWARYLARLEEVAGGGEPGPDPSLAALP
jgi:uncharacterized protein YndB with AHSA1/START domain